MFNVVRKSLTRVGVLVVCFLLTLGMTACSLGKSNDKQEEETAVEVTVDQAEGTKKETTDKASADKKDDKSDKKDDKNNDKKNDSADKNADKKNDKKNTSKSDDKSGKSEGNNNTGGNSGGSYSGNGGTTVVYTEQPKKEEPKVEEPKTEEPKKEEPTTEEPRKEEPTTEEPKKEEPTTEEPKTEEPTTEEPTTEEPKPEKKEEQKIEFSGDPDDVIIVDANSCYEGKKFFLFIEEGCEVHGDIAIKLADIMDELEKMYSLSYQDYDDKGDSDWREFYFDGGFQGINTDCKKVNILIVNDPEDGSVEWASHNVTMLFDDDMDPDNNMLDVAYHELTHVLRLRQSECMGDIFEEGIATYSQYHMAKDRNEKIWNIYIYTRDDGFINPFDESVILKDAEQAYRDIEGSERDSYQREYQYGIRFITFLIEEYGQDVIKAISSEALKSNLTYGDIDMQINIIKKATSEDVFERFASWLPDGWDRFTVEYNDYMKQFEETY